MPRTAPARIIRSGTPRDSAEDVSMRVPIDRKKNTMKASLRGRIFSLTYLDCLTGIKNPTSRAPIAGEKPR